MYFCVRSLLSSYYTYLENMYTIYFLRRYLFFLQVLRVLISLVHTFLLKLLKSQIYIFYTPNSIHIKFKIISRLTLYIINIPHVR